ncbi:MAG: C39 family peptidase [Candidatus Nealsonbacteria bacterium]
MLKKLIFFVISFLIATVFVVVFDSIFVIVSLPKVVEIFPVDKSQNVSLDSTIRIKFDKPIKRQEIKMSIYPEVHGEWRFEDSIIENHFYKTLIFVPVVNFKQDTQYQIKLENIMGFGLKKTNSFEFNFKTKQIDSEFFQENNDEQEFEDNGFENEDINIDEKKQNNTSLNIIEPEITMLDINIDYQDYFLSCEAASLKMALSGKGVYVSEDEIMEKIGYDSTPHKGDIWGNAHQKYVGDINGKMCATGFGVFWDPVAKTAQNWREAEAFSNWTIQNLTDEITNGNPVVFWGVMPTGRLTNCSWSTPDGEYIKAFKETHVRLIIGFIGPKENPSKIIINDPLSGRLYWSTSDFYQNWAIYNYSGVVIR